MTLRLKITKLAAAAMVMALLLLLTLPLSLSAQVDSGQAEASSVVEQAKSAVPETKPTGMTDANTGNYVALAVTLMVWFGLFWYLTRLDHRIKQLERRND